MGVLINSVNSVNTFNSLSQTRDFGAKLQTASKPSVSLGDYGISSSLGIGLMLACSTQVGPIKFNSITPSLASNKFVLMAAITQVHKLDLSPSLANNGA